MIPDYGLLHQTGVKEQVINIFEINGFKAFFKSSVTKNNVFPFDIFSAGFYLISRYEEYLPHEKDKYGRYSYKNSLAFKQNFLHLPLVNTWLNYFSDYLQNKFSSLNIEKSRFHFIPTYDVDIAYAYRQKGFIRNALGGVQSLLRFKLSDVTQGIKVLAGNEKDPYDNFNWLDTLHEQYKLKPLYFFLVSGKNSLYDKNILPNTRPMQELINFHGKKYMIGIHPSWQSGDGNTLIKKEKETLEKISNIQIQRSRQHYLRFSLPEGYRRLIDTEITEDYSMGYGTVNGFRASVALPFYWYDLKNEVQTKLKIFPFCYMDSTVIFNQRLSADNAYNELTHYYNICKNVQGTFISIFHNHLLGNDNLKWRNIYEKFLNKVAGEVNA